MNTQLFRLQAVRFHLLGDQVTLGDLDLFVLGVALEPDDLHSVEQRLRHVERVGGGDEHHVRKVVIELQIMVLELAVLFRDRALRAAPTTGSPRKSWPSLSISSSRNSGFDVPGLLDVRDDLARQRADVGSAVAADLGFVANPAQ